MDNYNKVGALQKNVVKTRRGPSSSINITHVKACMDT